MSHFLCFPLENSKSTRSDIFLPTQGGTLYERFYATQEDTENRTATKYILSGHSTGIHLRFNLRSVSKNDKENY